MLLAALLQPVSPYQAARAAEARHGIPRGTLVAIVARESRGYPVAIHDRDAWRRAVAVGWLDPERCEHHRDRPGHWSTRGPAGLMAAYHVRYLDRPCAPPEVLDDPRVAAEVAARKWLAVCRGRAPDRWCG